MNSWLLLVPLFPVLAALGILTVGRRLPRRGGWVATGSLVLSTIGLAVLAGSGVLSGETIRMSTPWLTVGELTLTAGFMLDGLSWWTATVVAAVCLLVTLYAAGYMEDEEDQPRFFALMAFFAGAMLALVLSSSLALLFMAWEGVGLASFGLIGLWYNRDDSRRAARKAFVMTRLGDLGLLLGWLLALSLTGTTSIEALYRAVEEGSIVPPVLTLLGILFFAAAVGKSAQLPLTAWLPDAMAGPTPVSALLHSATMVAAGVYLVLRLFPLFEGAPHVLTIVLWTGAITAVAGAVVATAQHDLKRILAWSTVSQIGEMMMALGLAGPIAAAYHLTTHAVFKSSLFLCAGAVDHGAGSRDLRELGSLRKTMPLTAVIFGASALALAGFPPFAGFWSEEKILGAAQAHHPGWGLVMLTLIFLAGVYIGRTAWAAFGRWPDAPAPSGSEPAAAMLAPMILLGAAALVLGYAVKAPVEHVLPFQAATHHLGLWRWAAIALSSLGLAVGALRVRSAGPVPAFGRWPRVLSTGVYYVVRVPARAALLLTTAANFVEHALDALASTAGRGAFFTGLGAQRAESHLDAAARRTGQTVLRSTELSEAAERTFDAAAREAGYAALQSADVTERAERTGFGEGLDGFAHALRRIGRRLRALQTGQISQYAFSLFAWVLLASLIAVVLWL